MRWLKSLFSFLSNWDSFLSLVERAHRAWLALIVLISSGGQVIWFKEIYENLPPDLKIVFFLFVTACIAIIVFFIDWLIGKLKSLWANDLREGFASECEELANEIVEFIYERNTSSPSFFSDIPSADGTIDVRDFNERAKHGEQTRYQWERKIDPKLRDLSQRLRENGHRPDEQLVFGMDALYEIKVEKLNRYARLLRNGEFIVDDRLAQFEKRAARKPT